MEIFRLYRRARFAGDHAGALLSGGRWNSIGTPMLYASRHLSLACMEMLIHMDKLQLPEGFVWSSAELPESPKTLEVGPLEDVPKCQAAGDSWIREGGQLAARVRSVVVPQEYNVLLNPNHPGYKELEWTEPMPFRFDKRLFTSEPRVP